MKTCKPILLFSFFSIFINYTNAQLVEPVNTMRLEGIDGEIIIDGYDDECGWGDVTFMNDPYKESDDYRGEKDLGGYFRINYDYSNIYFFAHVTDDTAIMWDGASDYNWEYDNIDVFFNIDTSNVSNSGNYAPDGIEIRFYRGDDTIEYGIGWGNGEDAKAPFPAEDKIIRKKIETEGGWNVEAAIPWIYLAPSGILPEDVLDYIARIQYIGFDVEFCDTDHPVLGFGASEVRIAWDKDGNDGAEYNAWRDTRLLGLLRITRESNGNCTVGNENIHSSQINIYPSVVKDKLILENVKAGAIIEIFNLNGELLISKKAAHTNGEINVLNISSGVYILKVQGEIFKFVKE